MAASIRFNEDERTAMDGLPYVARLLYFYIRERMDFRTGFVGASNGARVSWQAFRESLYVEPHQGYTESGSPTQSKLRRAAVLLEKNGLVVNKTQGKQLIFYLPLASRDQSVRNKPDTNPTGQVDSNPDIKPDTSKQEVNTSKTNVYHFYNVEGDTQGDTQGDIGKTAKPDTHPVSGNNTSYIETEPIDVPYEKPSVSMYEVLQLCNDKGVRIGSMLDNHNRNIISGLIDKGATLNDFITAIQRAYNSKRGGAFGVSYLEPIVNEIVFKRNNPEVKQGNRNGTKTRKRSAAERYRDSVGGSGVPERDITNVAKRVD